MALPGTPQEHPPELPEAGGPGGEKPEVTPQSKATSCWLSRGPGRKQPHQRSPCSNWVCLLCSPGRAFLVALTLWSASGSAGLLLPSDLKPLILRDIESGFFHPQVFRFPLNSQAGGLTRPTVLHTGTAHSRFLWGNPAPTTASYYRTSVWHVLEGSVSPAAETPASLSLLASCWNCWISR